MAVCLFTCFLFVCLPVQNGRLHPDTTPEHKAPLLLANVSSAAACSCFALFIICFFFSSILEGSSPDGYNPTSQEARDQDVECGACQQSAGHAAPDAGAGSGDAPGHKHDATRAPVLHKAESKCTRLRRTLSKLATKAGFRTANTLCTAIILCIMLFAFLVLAKELGWHVLHPSNSFKDLQ